MLFHVGHLIAPNHVVVRTADTGVLIIALTNMEKLPAGINLWLIFELYTNNPIRYENVNKLRRTLGNSLYIALQQYYIGPPGALFSPSSKNK